ncbi:MAG: hypothetical protein ACTFAK_06275 [Candidatus Electronema sp. VV]
MSRFIYSGYQVVTIVILFLLFAHSSFGQSCPPCTAEITARDQAQERVNNAKNAIPAAEQAAQTAEDNLRFAAAGLVAAEAANIPPNPIATIAVVMAAAVVDYCHSQLQIAMAELSIARNEIDIANIFLQRAETALSECQNRIPGICKKCQGGSVVTDYSGTCDDFDPCTAGDHCSDSGCVGTPIENPTPSSPECL